LPGIERASAFTNTFSGVVYRGEARIDAQMRRTDANYWKILDFDFLEGRPFTADEEARGASVAVISDDFRERLFGRGGGVGQTIEIDGQHYTVIGVVPAVSRTRRAGYSDMWVPLTTAKSSAYRDEFIGEFNAVVLAPDPAARVRIQRELAAIVSRVQPSDPKQFEKVTARLDTPYEAFAHDVLGGFRSFRENAPAAMRVVLALLAVAFMTLPALNLVTLNLSRIMERMSEIGVRKAFGAPRRVLIAQFVTENVVLTLIGGLCAFVLAIFAVELVNRSGVIPHADFSMNARVFIYGMLAAAFFGIFSGAYPAWRMSRLNPVDALRGGAA
ncbi:MAG TPA: ABC transporter permease, partial [Thermoanaerobaculia bacterium]|nr:ABC transporter permease [Thermoanaerobaculia bacterium]